MTDLAWYAFSTGGAVVAVTLAAAFVWLRPQSRAVRRVLLWVVAFYWLASTWGLSHRVFDAIGSEYRPLRPGDVPPGRAAVVIMGSGSYTTRDWEGGEFSTPDFWSAGRVLEAARVFRMVDPLWIISSGGPIADEDGNQPSAVTMRDALLALGIPEDRVLFETRPWNTASEAAVLAERLGALEIEHTILVTSQVHMRRSVGAFRAHDVPVIPAPARPPDEPQSWVTRWLPSDEGLYLSALAAHEILGLAYYTLRGWYRPS